MFGFLKKKLSEFKEKVVGRQQISEKKPESELQEKVKEPAPTKTVQEPTSKVVPKQKVSTEPKKAKVRKRRNKEIKKQVSKKKPISHTKTSHELTKTDRKAKPSLLKKIKRAVSKKYKLSPAELDDYLWDLELILLEADVAHEIAEDIVQELRSKLENTEFESKADVFEQIVSELKDYLLRNIPTPIDILKVKKEPTTIMFVGPNGAGKTTTIAKLAKKVLDSGHTVIFAASDTFRAASIEQLEEHASRLGVRVVKHKYGSDPAAVAFDAVQSARAKGINFVFIDTAGRQETNKNLLEELKKIKRVVKPDFIVYVDEGIAGNVIFDRLKAFGELGLSGIILTKMDLDAKGGGAITAASMGVPILYLGVGQSYDDIKPFDPEEFVNSLLGD